jgi:antitoxin MazE
MKVDIVSIGNSRGIRIPKALLEQCGFSDSAEIEIRNHTLVVSPLAKPRKGWDDAFAAMNKAKDDRLLDVEVATDFDATEWKW